MGGVIRHEIRKESTASHHAEQPRDRALHIEEPAVARLTERREMVPEVFPYPPLLITLVTYLPGPPYLETATTLALWLIQRSLCSLHLRLSKAMVHFCLRKSWTESKSLPPGPKDLRFSSLI